MRLLVFILAALAAAPAAYPQSAQILQAAVDDAGKSCPSVTKMKSMGVDENGDAVFAVACAGADSHVVLIHEDYSVSYISACSVYLAKTGRKCFR